MASSVAAAASTFLGTRLADPAPQNGRIVARFGFGKKKAPPKKAKAPPTTDRPLWFPGAQAPEYLDGTLVGDYGFDPFGLGKPAEYLQYDVDSLDQNLAQNLAGEIIGTRFEDADVKSTPFQPYAEVFGLQRFRECELIHGRWAMLATLGALTVEWLTGVTWQDAGKVELVDGSSYPVKKETLQLAEIKHARLAMVAFLGFAVQAAATGKGPLNNWATHLSDPLHTTIFDTFGSS
ncbi:unnamed protein product [Triticum turgidum subsp. durum]|uniref:Chlorophyll a-b binding protein, chloroplastic n=1 Tax=Triticum turgidum subsp. durum TaxID=4567 RepID=A0A9R1PK67_TRITD|nr:unnamed protein product [Triticum turgidum subsp. durum]